METNGPSGRVTNSTGGVDRDGQIVGGYQGTGTMIDPGHYQEREGLDERLTAACVGLVADQASGIRRMLARVVA